MNDKLNGSAPPVTQQVQVLQHVIPRHNGAKLVITLSNGVYIGSVEYDMPVGDAQFYKVLGDTFQQFCATQSGGLAIAKDLPPGLTARIPRG